MVEENWRDTVIEVTEPMKLELGAPITFRHHHDRATQFFFDVDREAKFTIECTEEVENERRVDLYINVADDMSKKGVPGPKNFTWCSEYGLNDVELDPNTDLFK